MYIPTINHPPIGRTGRGQPNFTEVTIGNLTVWYSYRTPVGFMYPGQGRVVRQNDWSVTTGKHLNYIDDGDKAARVTGEEFTRRLYALPMCSELLLDA